MKYFHPRVFRLCCTACLLLFALSSSGQKVKDFLLGTWLGYITIDGKPVFKVSILTGENDDKTFVAGIYYYPFTKNGDAFRYDTVKLNINEHDTTASFDMAIPKLTGGNYCKGKVIVRRPNLYTMQIASRYLPYQNCQQ